MKITANQQGSNAEINTLTIHYAVGCESAMDLLKNQLVDSALQLHFLPLDLEAQHQTETLMVICQDEGQANQLVQHHAWQQTNLYWLPASSVKTSPTTLVGQWLANWHRAPWLSPILNLLAQQQSLHWQNLRQKNILHLMSSCLGEHLLVMDVNGLVLEVNNPLINLTGLHKHEILGQHWHDLFSIPSVTAQARMNSLLCEMGKTKSMTRLPPFPIQFGNTVLMVDGVAGPLPDTDHEILLIMRQVASWQNQDWMETDKTDNLPVSLMLINPDNLIAINKKYSHELGDHIINEITKNMTKLLRADDFVTRYSGAVFAAHLPNTQVEHAQLLAQRMHQHLRQQIYSSHKINIDFSIGVATLDAKEQLGEHSPIELFRRANTALQAARNVGGGKLVSWRAEFDSNVIANLDRMSGKFSNAPDDDFRLMLLQWEIIRLIGASHSLKTFSSQLCQLLLSGLNSQFVGLYSFDAQALIPLFNVRQADTSSTLPNNTNIQRWTQKNIDLTPSKPAVDSLFGDFVPVFIPLITREQNRGALVILWHKTEQYLSTKCGMQIQQIAPNLAATLDHLLLLEQNSKQTNIKPHDGIFQTTLVYQSSAMRTLMQQVQLVGPTDATVLIIGESGTGKELIAQQIHNNSLRPEKPFITVDCSTIVEHLIESELFGHRRGAFTGATSDQPGRIAQADGGSLFLDEIGELPLDIQSKLLRFVQEKTYVSVGDQRVKKVDVRLILATNRNLVNEVSQGRFRGDLYYRINVFTVNLPTLRERGQDSVVLSRHYVKQYNQHYGKSIIGLSEQAEAKILAYSWPGNVRELQNSVMRAVILCQDEKIEIHHLHLQNQTGEQIEIEPALQPRNISLAAIEIENVLSELVQYASSQMIVDPISIWLEKYIVELCMEQWGSLYQVSQKLKLPESTLRRRYQKSLDTAFTLQLPSLLSQRLADHLIQFLQTQAPQDLWTKLEDVLLSVILKLELSQQQRATLLNVSQPTLRKMIGQSISQYSISY